jgi:hypothetical protein
VKREEERKSLTKPSRKNNNEAKIKMECMREKRRRAHGRCFALGSSAEPLFLRLSQGGFECGTSVGGLRAGPGRRENLWPPRA